MKRNFLYFICGIFVAAIITSCSKYPLDGKEGDITWKISKNGTLTISGKGVIPSYMYGTAPWAYHNNSLTALVIEEGITGIGDSSFSGCDGFTGSLILPEGVRYIGESGFNSCSGFSSLTIPETCTRFKLFAFSFCRGFKYIINHAIEPQSASYHEFEDVPIKNITLYVPNVSLEKYRNADFWKNFGNIVAIEDSDIH
jgi:hypothetical protein